VVPRVPVMERQYELAPAMVVALVVMVRLVVVVKVVVGRRWTEVQKVGSECVEVLVAAAAVAPAPALAPAAGLRLRLRCGCFPATLCSARRSARLTCTVITHKPQHF
jgi:hypothetical protein